MSIAEKLNTIVENVPKVYKAGHDDLWEGIINTRENFSMQFKDWQMEYMRPPQKIAPVTVGSANQMLRGNTLLKKVESEYFDFSRLATGTSNQEGFHYTFYGCSALEEVEDVGIGVSNSIYSFNYTFNGCSQLHTISKLTVADTTKFINAFNACRRLVNLTINGTIGQSGLDLHWSPLSKTSIESVIGALSETTSGLSITLSKVAINNAFGINLDDESTYPEGSEYYTLRHSRDNWTINYS